MPFPWCRSHQRCLAPQEQSHRLHRSQAGRQLNRPSGNSYTFDPATIASAPSAPPVTETHWASTPELQRPKLEKDSHLLTDETARRTAKEAGPEGPASQMSLTTDRVDQGVTHGPAGVAATVEVEVARVPVPTVMVMLVSVYSRMRPLETSRGPVGWIELPFWA